MKATVFLGLLGCASANIIFNHVQLTCDATNKGVNNVDGITGCLRGQVCQLDGTCISPQMRRDGLYNIVESRGELRSELTV